MRSGTELGQRDRFSRVLVKVIILYNTTAKCILDLQDDDDIKVFK